MLRTNISTTRVITDEASNEVSPPPLAIRVLVIVRPGSIIWPTAWEHPEDVVSSSISLLQQSDLLSIRDDDLQELLLVRQRFQRFIHIVFDKFHDSYDAAMGHLPENNRLPVLIVTFGKSSHVRSAEPRLRKLVNTQIAMVHNLNGINSVPPFIEDHTSGVTPLYLAPREPSWLDCGAFESQVATQEQNVSADKF